MSASKSTSSSSRSICFPLVFMLVLLAETCIARQFVSTKLLNSPLGIGVRSALQENHQFASVSRRKSLDLIDYDDDNDNDDSIQRYATPSDNESRFASISREGVQPLGLALTPKLVRATSKSSSMIGDDELEYLKSTVVPCAAVKRQTRRVVGVTSPKVIQTSDTRGGTVAILATRPLFFWESMVSGAISRSVAQTLMHPANTMKTILQRSRTGPTFQELLQPKMFKTLTRGAGANFILSVPHGAVNFAVLEFVRSRLSKAVQQVPFLERNQEAMGPGLDFMSSAISTICCSVVSTPQMMITDNIMAGNYPNLGNAVTGLYASRGVMGFYSGWWPGLVGKIPSYALTWTFFQQLKLARDRISGRPAKNYENTIMGCIASGTTVCIMIPMDTIKTRLVTQMSGMATSGVAYKGITDCAVRIMAEEGIGTFYRGLAPRLISVVPMIGIQFGVYEAMKKAFLYRSMQRTAELQESEILLVDRFGSSESLVEAAMEVAASPEHPYPAPRFLRRIMKQQDDKKKRRPKRAATK